MLLHEYEDGTTFRFRGCLPPRKSNNLPSGYANFTTFKCTPAYAEKKQCTILNNGEQVILDVLKGFSVIC